MEPFSIEALHAAQHSGAPTMTNVREVKELKDLLSERGLKVSGLKVWHRFSSSEQMSIDLPLGDLPVR